MWWTGFGVAFSLVTGLFLADRVAPGHATCGGWASHLGGCAEGGAGGATLALILLLCGAVIIWMWRPRGTRAALENDESPPSTPDSKGGDWVDPTDGGSSHRRTGRIRDDHG